MLGEAARAEVATGVSGGKDSTAVAFATVAHLNAIGHRGPRLLVHAALGAVEWADSLPACERLAAATGLELLVVRRKRGGMMERWEQRWRDNVRRWESLACVKLILPWSTPAMRFCTAELKVDPITQELKRRFPGRTIVNVTGIRAEESRDRANAPLCAPHPKLTSKTNRTAGVAWNPILRWPVAAVWAIHERYDFAPHEAYTRFGAPRVSCVNCMIGTEECHRAGARDERNHAIGRRQVDLEIVSTFAFQGSRWLGDTLAAILTHDQRAGLARAKEAARLRTEAESLIPKHLLYTKNWPTCVPTRPEAELLASVRLRVADAVGLRATFTDPDEVIARYEQLLAEKAAKEAVRTKRTSRKRAA